MSKCSNYVCEGKEVVAICSISVLIVLNVLAGCVVLDRLFVLEGEASSFRVVEEERDLALAKAENLKQLFREKSDEVNQLRDMAENIVGYEENIQGISNELQTLKASHTNKGKTIEVSAQQVRRRLSQVTSYAQQALGSHNLSA